MDKILSLSWKFFDQRSLSTEKLSLGKCFRASPSSLEMLLDPQTILEGSNVIRTSKPLVLPIQVLGRVFAL